MKLLQANNDPTKYAFVDDDIFEIIQDMKLKFSVRPKGYFYSTTEIKLQGMTEKKRLQLHRFVFTLKTGKEPSSSIDHQDINPSNNQFKNLRLATRQEQQQHRGKQKSNTSGYIGINHHRNVDKRRKKNNVHDYWRAQIHKPDGHREAKLFHYTENGKQHAAMWYDTKAIEYHCEFHGQLNFPSDKDK